METTETGAKSTNSSSQDFQFLASQEELDKSGGQMTRWVGDHDVLLYKHEGQIKALSNICRHFGGPVGFHKAQDGKFRCLWHNWEFSCDDGTCLTHSGLPLREYQLKIENNNIYVNLLG